MRAAESWESVIRGPPYISTRLGQLRGADFRVAGAAATANSRAKIVTASDLLPYMSQNKKRNKVRALAAIVDAFAAQTTQIGTLYYRSENYTSRFFFFLFN